MENITTADGIELVAAQWPALAPAHGSVLIVHGLGEHMQRYAWLAGKLNTLGWNVLGWDLRGHGLSGGPRGGIAAGDCLLTDLARMIDQARRDRPGRLLLLGHSMGGLIASRFVAEALMPAPAAWSRPVDALVMSSAALDPGMSTFQKLLLAIGSRMAPDQAVGNGLKPEWISRDPVVVKAYVGDSLVHDRVTPRLVRFIVDGGRVVHDAAPRWQTPALVLWAGADRCVAPNGSAAFVAAAASSSAVQARRFDGLYHEIFNEPERDEVFAHLAGLLAGFSERTLPAARPAAR